MIEIQPHANYGCHGAKLFSDLLQMKRVAKWLRIQGRSFHLKNFLDFPRLAAKRVKLLQPVGRPTRVVMFHLNHKLRFPKKLLE